MAKPRTVYFYQVSAKERAEIEICTHCPLPDCVTVFGALCPLKVRRLISKWWKATAPAQGD